MAQRGCARPAAPPNVVSPNDTDSASCEGGKAGDPDQSQKLRLHVIPRCSSQHAMMEDTGPWTLGGTLGGEVHFATPGPGDKLARIERELSNLAERMQTLTTVVSANMDDRKRRETAAAGTVPATPAVVPVGNGRQRSTNSDDKNIQSRSPSDRQSAHWSRQQTFLSVEEDNLKRSIALRASVSQKPSLWALGNDSSADAQARVLSGFFLREEDKAKTLLSDHPIRCAADLLILLMTSCEVFLVVLEVFDAANSWGSPPHLSVVIILVAATVVAFGHVAINFHTCVLQDFEIIGDENEEVPLLRRLYLGGWFSFDFGLSVPWDLLALPFSSKAWFVLFSLRSLRVIRITSLFQPSSPLNDRPGWVKSLLGTFSVLFALHFVACCWLLVDAQSGWQGLESEPERSQMGRYANGLYWAVMTMTTVGYGDITPTTPLARFFTTIVILVGASGYAWVVGNVSNLIAVNDEFERQSTAQKQYLSSVLKHYSVPLAVQKEAFAVFPQIIEQTVMKNEGMLMQLPADTKKRIFLAVKLDFLSIVDILRAMSKLCLVELALNTTQREYLEEDLVFEAGDTGKELFVVFRGVLEVLEGSNDQPIGSFGYRSYFGERSLIEETERTMTLRCATNAEMFVLTDTVFAHVLERYPSDRRLAFGAPSRGSFFHRRSHGSQPTRSGSRPALLRRLSGAAPAQKGPPRALSVSEEAEVVAGGHEMGLPGLAPDLTPKKSSLGTAPSSPRSKHSGGTPKSPLNGLANFARFRDGTKVRLPEEDAAQARGSVSTNRSSITQRQLTLPRIEEDPLASSNRSLPGRRIARGGTYTVDGVASGVKRESPSTATLDRKTAVRGRRDDLEDLEPREGDFKALSQLEQPDA
eukprot:TRINITY_DN14734_c0_g1_i1.p1 TRINITY_DN14734_c0_g1~~TRINITY_DN14734_c0_g1_i1.p1  ORF type:complete len:893 (+),score=229.48 TRINITY_DN14734_c0_g1_i1:78-2681(+)